MLSARRVGVCIALLVGCAEEPWLEEQRGASGSGYDAGAEAPHPDAQTSDGGLDAALAQDAQVGTPDPDSPDAAQAVRRDASASTPGEVDGGRAGEGGSDAGRTQDAGTTPTPGGKPDAGKPPDPGGPQDAGSDPEAPDWCALQRGEDGGPYATFTEVYALLRQACPGCHEVGIYGLNISSRQRAYQDLVSGPKKGAPQHVCKSSGLVYVVPCAPDQSLLIRKFGTEPPCGGKMPPPNYPALSAAQVELVRSWIAGGALDD